MILAIKYNEDDYYSNEYYAKVGGITNEEYNNLEMESFILIENKLWISEDIYDRYKNYFDNYQDGVEMGKGEFFN